jgi:hypothetical protein
MAADLDRDPPALRKTARDLVPGAAMKAGGVGKEDGRVRARPFPSCNLNPA